jgi:hypothetical protein
MVGNVSHRDGGSSTRAYAPHASTPLTDEVRGWATRPSTRSRQVSTAVNPAATRCAGSASRRSHGGIIFS